jgi:hypothetical protein
VSKQRNVMTRVLAAGVSALTLGGVVVGGLAGSASAVTLPSNVNFSQWSDAGFQWTTGDLNTSGTNASNYREGETVPFLIDVTSAGVGTYSFSVCRDYMRNNAYGYLSLLPYDTNRIPQLPVVATNIEAATGASQPFTGAAVGGSVHILSAHEVGDQGICAKGQRETQLQITIGAGVGGLAPIAAYVLYGGRLASPVDALPGGGFVGIGNGASSYPGATLSMGLPAAQKTLSIKVGAAAAGTLTVNDIVAPSADPGRFDLQIDGSTAGTGANVGDGGTTGVIPVYSGSHDVGAAGSGTTNIGDYTSSVICADGNGPVAVTGGSVSVPNGANVVCTVTLTANPVVVIDPTPDPTPDPGPTTDPTTSNTDPTTSSTTTTTTVPSDTSSTDPTTSSTTTTTDPASTSSTDPTTSSTTTTTTLPSDTSNTDPTTSSTTTTTDPASTSNTDPTTSSTTTTTTTTVSTDPDPVVINDPLPTTSSTTTTTAPKHHTQPSNDDGSGGDNSDVDPTDTTPTTITTTTVDPGSTVAGGGQPAQQVPEVLGAVAAQPAPASDPAPAADPAPAMAPAGTLPRTGTAVARETGLGMVLLAAGLAFVGFSRRRRQSPQR